MTYTTLRRATAAVLTTLLALATFAPTASAARPTRVDFTVSETLPIGTPGTVADSNVASCATGTVTTPTVDSYERGPRTVFVGTKMIDCGDGNSLTLRFVAVGRECDETNRGRWRITDGTGVFEDARGGGRLVGSYVAAGGGQGDFCDNVGVDDRYTGRIRLAT